MFATTVNGGGPGFDSPRVHLFIDYIPIFDLSDQAIELSYLFVSAPLSGVMMATSLELVGTEPHSNAKVKDLDFKDLLARNCGQNLGILE